MQRGGVFGRLRAFEKACSIVNLVVALEGRRVGSSVALSSGVRAMLLPLLLFLFLFRTLVENLRHCCVLFRPGPDARFRGGFSHAHTHTRTHIHRLLRRE